MACPILEAAGDSAVLDLGLVVVVPVLIVANFPVSAVVSMVLLAFPPVFAVGAASNPYPSQEAVADLEAAYSFHLASPNQGLETANWRKLFLPFPLERADIVTPLVLY